MKKYHLIITPLLLIIIIFFSFRFFSHVELDDLHPSIQCDDELIKRSDVLWVIPLFDNDSIALHPDWCEYLLSFNKTLGLHGVYHTYQEFNHPRNDSYLRVGLDAFKSCFNITPEKFKPPQVKYDSVNDDLLKRFNLSFYGEFNQITHKVYHCSDTGLFKNWFVRVF